MSDRLLAKRPDSSFGGVPVGYFLDEVRMKEERVKVQVQAEEEETRETHGREQSEEKEREQTITQAHDMDDHADETKRAPTHS